MKNTLTLVSRALVVAMAVSTIGAATAQATVLFPRKTDAAVPAARATSALSAADKKFIMAAAKGGMMEVAMGQMASEKAQSPEVKKIGKMMVTDHTTANSELMAIAKARGVSLNEKPAMGAWKSDKEYLAMMAKDHQKDLTEFQNEAQNGNDPELKKFASKTSAVIQRHLERVKGVQGKMKS